MALSLGNQDIVTSLVQQFAQREGIEASTVHPTGYRSQVPLAKKLAEEHSVDLTAVAGTGRNGTITAEKVKQAAGIAS